MVFSSIPVYLDPPNWHQQQSHHQQHALAATAAETNPQLPPLPPPPPLGHHAAPGPGSGSIRPGSMADRARLAKIPQPEAALKCPRCESTNTKFCYFNNYSLTQPRHFCKTCRRYWTSGGALRSVPVGGGCRRNKKTKSGNTRSKSPAAASASVDPAGNPSKSPGSAPAQAGSGASGGVISPSSGSDDMIGHFSHNPHSSFMASIQSLARFGGPGAGALGLGFCEIQGDHGGSGGLGFQIGPGSGDHGGAMLQGEHQWRLPQQQQFPLFGGGPDFDSPSSSTANLYPFHQGNMDPQSGNSNNNNNRNTMVGMMTSSPGGSRVSQFPPVKLEGRQGLNLSSRPELGVSENSSHFWAGNSSNTTTPWTDLTGLNSASTSHLL